MLYCITLGPGIYVDQFDTPLWSEQVWCAANALVPDSMGSPERSCASAGKSQI